LPYASDAQRRYMHAKHPRLAAKWDKEIREHKDKHGHGGHSHADGPAKHCSDAKKRGK